MENNRLLLIIALSAVTFLLWDAWQRDYGPQPETPVASSSNSATGQTSAEVPTAGEVPSAPAASSTTGSSAIPEAKAVSAMKRGQRVEVTTDVFHAIIDTTGGDLRIVDLKKYPTEVKKPDSPIRFMDDKLPNIFVAQSGFAGKKSKSAQVTTSSPNHYSIYKVSKDRFTLADGADSMNVDLSWTSSDGVQFTKRYIFKRGSYEVEVDYLINNKSGKEWRGNSYYQLQRTNSTSLQQSRFVYSYMGGVIYSPENKYEKVDFGDMEDDNLSRDIKDGWAAMIQHYFLAAWIPQAGTNFNYFTRTINNNERYVLGFKSASEYSVAKGEQANIKARMFVGPKLQYKLETIAPGLELTVDYGWLTFISKPIFWLLNKIHSMVGNWGWRLSC